MAVASAITLLTFLEVRPAVLLLRKRSRYFEMQETSDAKLSSRFKYDNFITFRISLFISPAAS